MGVILGGKLWARLACYDAVPTVNAGATAATAEAGFGFEQKRDEQLKVIVSRIVGQVDGWGPGTRFRLENGQVWQLSDDSNAVYNLNSPAVKIERAMLGGFEMAIEGVKRAPRVKPLESLWQLKQVATSTRRC
jgi:hypothetical protein